MRGRCIIGLFLCIQTTLLGVGLDEYRLNKSIKQSLEANEYEQAAVEQTQLIELNRDNGYYWHNLGQIALKQEDPDVAIQHFQQALSQLPESEDVPTKLSLSGAYLSQQKADKAIELLTDILTKDPAHMAAKHNLEMALQLQEFQPPQQQEQSESSESSDDQEQEQTQAQQQGQEEQEEDDDKDEKDNNKQSGSEASDKTPLEKEREQALQKDQEKQREKEAAAVDILDALSQREEEARQKYMKARHSNQGVSDHDW